MSFIYDDKNLIDQLLLSGLDFEVKFSKKGQAAAASVNASNDYANLRSLIVDLSKQLLPKDPNAAPAASVISYEGDANNKPKMTSTHLEGLGALVNFLEMNKITVDGKRIAYSQGEDPKSQEYQLYQLEGNAGLLEVADRSQVTNGRFVNKDLLKAFIMSRLAALSQQPNKVEEVQLGVLIQEANKLLGTNINPVYNKPVAPTQPGATPAQPAATPAQPGKGVQGTQQFIQSMVQNLPLDRNDIDFTRIRDFFKIYSQFLSASTNPRKAEVDANIATAERAMIEASGMTSSGDTRFPMTRDYTEIRDMIKPPVGGMYIPFLLGLQSVVEATAKVVGQFYATYIRKSQRAEENFTSEQREEVEQQILGDNSAKVQNLEILQGLQRNLPKVMTFK